MRSTVIMNVASVLIIALLAAAAMAAIPEAIERQARADLNEAITNCERGYQAACSEIFNIKEATHDHK